MAKRTKKDLVDALARIQREQEREQDRRKLAAQLTPLVQKAGVMPKPSREAICRVIKVVSKHPDLAADARRFVNSNAAVIR